jgi:hypothetical protein
VTPSVTWHPAHALSALLSHQETGTKLSTFPLDASEAGKVTLFVSSNNRSKRGY